MAMQQGGSNPRRVIKMVVIVPGREIEGDRCQESDSRSDPDVTERDPTDLHLPRRYKGGLCNAGVVCRMCVRGRHGFDGGAKLQANDAWQPSICSPAAGRFR